MTEESRPFWTGGFDNALRIHRCRSCGKWFHPPVGACFRCRSRDVGPEQTSGRARVAAYTVNHHPWFEAFPPPYVIAAVELEEQPDVRLTTCLVDCEVEQVQVGMAVEVAFDLQDDVALPFFRPVTA
ncbi:Zn-ribbon domain-containing OB-fold protein [Streptomyces sulphureus]|uniref:Zn-ribbon domain-containing OB-fold protein n=1 Tax=Streptomyces sulphureus TaxID=47758 RepID=UPI0003613A39|nr:OB-fold domain-containing protein [Streptomyces sulphureus]